VYRDASATPDGHWYSPHAHDPDMPRHDAAGEGLCLNCHDPHGSGDQRDLLMESYRGMAGHADLGAPAAYRACFSCHGNDGPAGMDVSNRYIEDWYDSGLNGDFAGHQIRRNPAIALSWPARVQVGDKLACYDCHDPHGSAGGNGVEPNAFLLSDERPQWSGLEATLTDAKQARKFCLGCHIPADGMPGSQAVQGIVMNTLSPQEAHQSLDLRSCYECHGNDYSGPTAHNVHNPSLGIGVADPNRGFGEPWRR
jgi:predicted CXXCH cytochrome family protein